MAFPISQRAAVDPDESTAEAIANWHYRVARATDSDLCTATESSRCFDTLQIRLVQDLPEEERSEPKRNFGSPRSTPQSTAKTISSAQARSFLRRTD